MHTGPDPITDEQIQGYVLSVLRDKHGEYKRQAERNAKEADDKATMPRDRPVCRAWAEVSTRYADTFQVALRAAEMAFQAKAPTVETTVNAMNAAGFRYGADLVNTGTITDLAMAFCDVAEEGARPGHTSEANHAALDALCALWLVTRGKVPIIHVSEAKAEAAEVSP